MTERFEVHPVEPDEPALRAQPHDAVPVLGNPVHLRRFQSVLGRENPGGLCGGREHTRQEKQQYGADLLHLYARSVTKINKNGHEKE